MTPVQVQRLRSKIEARLDKWNEAYRMLQQDCQHPNVTKKHRSDTGNWDRSQDSYWTEWHCPDCDKRWTTEQK